MLRSILMSRPFRIIWLIALLMTPLVLWVLPADQFDHGAGLLTCPSVRFFDLECFGCGMTRAVMHMHHGEWLDALYFNYGIVIIYPVLIIAWLWLLRRVLRQLSILATPS